MGREQSAFSEKNGLNKGAWTPAEDKRLSAYVRKHGHGNWRTIPKMAGLARCGKSCRLRWINYLRPGLKRGSLSKEEEETLIRLHRELGNTWSQIAGHLPGRTDNEIKNIWNTHFKRRFGPKESKPSRQKPKEVPNPSQSVSCSNVASITSSKPIDNIYCSCAEEDSSDEKTNLYEYLDGTDFNLWPLDCTSNETSKEKTDILIDLDEFEDDFELWPTSVDCTFNENSNILIELEEFLGSEDFELAGNDCETSSSIASWQMAMHEDNNNNQAISLPSVSLCSNASTANNNGFNTELKNVDVLITELDECLQAMSADQFEVLGINDCQISSSSISLCSSASTANNNDFNTELKNVDILITELDECLQAMSANQFEVLGCQISSSSSMSAQMDCWDLDLMMDEMEDVVAIGSEFWSVLDDDGDCYSASTTMSLDQEESSSARGGKDNGWLVYFERELDLC